DPAGTVDPEQAAALGRLMPNVQAMLQDVVHDDDTGTLGWCDDRAEFEFALDILLEGIERRAGDEGAASVAPRMDR
ncbi:hypothetical protein ACWGR3_31185, partial [Streptomyces albidoflavus]